MKIFRPKRGFTVDKEEEGSPQGLAKWYSSRKVKAGQKYIKAGPPNKAIEDVVPTPAGIYQIN